MTRARDLPRFVSTWETGAKFRENVREVNGTKTFFHPVADANELLPEVVVGSIVSVSLRFVDRDTDFHVHGRVLERVTSGATPGLLLSFLPEERDRQELVLASAEGESVPYLRRKAVRTACNLDVQVTPEGGAPFASIISTISERGAHLENEALLTGQNVQIAITFPGQRAPVAVRGRITAKIAGPQSGVGVEFLFVASKQRDAFAAEVAAFRSRQI